MGCRSCGQRYNPAQPVVNRVPSGRYRLPRPVIAPVQPPASQPTGGAATPTQNKG